MSAQLHLTVVRVFCKIGVYGYLSDFKNYFFIGVRKMNSKNYVASYKGELEGGPLFTCGPNGNDHALASAPVEQVLMYPTKREQFVIARTVKTSVGLHITDMICPIGEEDSVEIHPVEWPLPNSIPNAIFVKVHNRGVYELSSERIEPDLRQMLLANISVVLVFRQSDRKFFISSFNPLIPNMLEGTFFYNEQRYKMGGKRAVFGSFTSTCGEYKNLPCKMLLATLTESGVFSQLTEGFSFDAKVKFELDEDDGVLIVTELSLPSYPDFFAAEIINASLIEKEKSDNNLLVCDFSYFQGLVSRVNITNKKLDVVAVTDSVSFSANLSFNAGDKFKFMFMGLAMPSSIEAKMTPINLNPYPCEFEFSCFGLVFRVLVKSDSWEAFNKSVEQVSYSGVSVPIFELNKENTLPVRHWQAEKISAEHTAWFPKVAFYLNELSIPETIESTFSYVKSEYRNGHLYYLLRRGEVDMHYPVLAAEFFLYGIAGFSKDASIDLRLEKYRRYDAKTKKKYRAKHPRGSKRNEWSVQDVISPLPSLDSKHIGTFIKAYSVIEWGRDVELMRLSNEYWETFSTQRRNYAYCALQGLGDIHPLVPISPLLLQKSGYHHLKPGRDPEDAIEVSVGSANVLSTDDKPQWRWVKELRPKNRGGSGSELQVKRLTCIEQEVVIPKKDDGSDGKKYLKLTLVDNKGQQYIYNKFKLGTYPLEDSDMDKYEHLALCTAKGEIVELREMVLKNEA